MAKEIVWDSLTPAEAETLTALVNSGEAVYAAPIEIEQDKEARKFQFKSLGISWAQCKTWRIGRDIVYVHPTPASKAVYDLLLSELRAKHRSAYRERRCMVPGKLKALIQCPEYNKCTECPFPEYRNQHQAREISWDELIESGYETASHEDADMSRIETRMTLDDVCEVIDAQNPLFTQAIILKEYYGLSVDDIAKRLSTTSRNVYYYLGEAKKIGRKIKEELDM